MNGIIGRWVTIDRYKDTKHQVMAVSYQPGNEASKSGHALLLATETGRLWEYFVGDSEPNVGDICLCDPPPPKEA